jgi:hypothetical protein
MQPNALLIRQNFIVAKSGCYNYILAPHSNPSLFCTLLSSLVHTLEDFRVGHPSWNCSRPSTPNPGVLCRWTSRKEGIPWWYEYSINPIKALNQNVTIHPLRRQTSPSVNRKPGMSPIGHVCMSNTGICVLYIQLAKYVPYQIPPRGPTRHTYIPTSLTRMLPYPY